MVIGEGYVMRSSLPVAKGSLTFQKKMGEGAQGQVWAVNGADNRLWAAKFVSHLRADGLGAFERMRAEIKLENIKRESRLIESFADTPGIVNCYGAETVGSMIDGMTYMLMDLVLGRSLYHIVKQDGVLEPEVAATRAYQVGLVLKRMHTRGIIHGDIKANDLSTTK